MRLSRVRDFVRTSTAKCIIMLILIILAIRTRKTFFKPTENNNEHFGLPKIWRDILQDIEEPIVSSEICDKWIEDMNRPLSSNPAIRLDPGRLIYPGNQNGPSNELIAFQEAILVGIATNRTIVIPNFVPHFTDQTPGIRSIIPAKERIDLHRLSKLVSLATVSEMQRKCHYQFNLGFQTRVASCNYIDYLRRTTHMTFDPKPEGVDEMIRLGKWKNCSSSQPFPVKRTPVRMYADDMKKIYSTDAKCIVTINMYKSKPKEGNTSIHDANIFDSGNFHPAKITEKASLEGARTIIEKFTARPLHVREIAKQFMREVLGGEKYVALHWRYNYEFLKTFCTPGKRMIDLCDQIITTSPRHLATALVVLSRQLLNSTVSNSSSKQESPRIIHAYIASGSQDYQSVKYIADDSNFFHQILSKLAKRDKENNNTVTFDKFTNLKLRVYDSINLSHFISTRYKGDSCSFLRKDLHELLSLVENELCHRSKLFAYSEKSSWSFVAMQNRNRRDKQSVSLLDILSDVITL